MKNLFSKDAAATGILTHWWQGLENDKGTRAELRRCDMPEKVMFHPAFPRLCRRLQPLLEQEWNWQIRLAALVGLLSHVRKTTGQTLAHQMAGNPPKVSELRFRRLLQREADDFYGAMIRVLPMLDHTANLPDLMSSVFYWGDPVRKRWAFDYFPNTPESKTA
ncbi:MAG: type I-E CRISPR-associated protein Cse2/CasB [Gammaproteobacteria bacterium]|mgnify:CR=1 FL=1|nr:type I-E CRISPR-associated protein Cse2/CasB [Gammaproteobacteria bacterium]